MIIIPNIICCGVCFFENFGNKTMKLISMDEFDDNFKKKKGAKYRVEKNRYYIDPKHRPRWCKKYNKKRIPCFYCLGPISGMKCPFLVISNCDSIEYDYAEIGLKILYNKLRKKHGEGFDWSKVRSKQEMKFHEKILREFHKEPGLGKIRGVMPR